MKARLIPAIALLMMAATWYQHGFSAMLLTAIFGACCYMMGARDCDEEPRA